MNESEAMFIDLKGNEIKYDDISSHIGIAHRYVTKNPEILKEFKNSKYAETSRYDLFLMDNLGFMTISNDPIYGTHLFCNETGLTDAQKNILKKYMLDQAEITYFKNEDSKEKSK